MYLVAAGVFSGALLLGAGTPPVDRLQASPVAGVLHGLSTVVDVVVAAYVASLVALALVCLIARGRQRWNGARP